MTATSPLRNRLQATLLITVVLLAPLAMRLYLWGFTVSGVLSDLFTGLLLASLLYRKPLALVMPLLLAWIVIQSGTIELVEAVGRMPGIEDARYLLDPAFLEQSSEGGGLTHTAYPAALLALTLLLALCGGSADTAPINRYLPVSGTCLAVCLLLMHQQAIQRETSASSWLQFNILHKLATESAIGLLGRENDHAARLWAMAERDKLQHTDPEGRPLLRQKGLARNVLIITMEGIPGAYIDQIRAQRGYQWDQQPMPLLSAFTRDRHAMHTADYVLHNHQTIRGLYSMLCGDYPKLDGSTPKAIEILASTSERPQYCLPAQLSAQGFATHFLQAADLSFMSKDRVMPRIGFQHTCGDNCLRQRKKSHFAWGLDDRDFFAGATDYIAQLRRQQQPWLLTLLTVGTHQPYDAPEGYLARYPDAKMAAVAYLDEAVTGFLTNLQKSGVLDDTLVIITSDESHGIDELRLASAWGLNIILAPEHEQLPLQKQGTYGHVDLAYSVMDYLGLPAGNVMGRSLFRDYPTGRSMLSYTNGLLRFQQANGQFHECQFQDVCHTSHQDGFINPAAGQQAPSGEQIASQTPALARELDNSLALPTEEQDFLFAHEDKRKLKSRVTNEWVDNLIGAQYLEFASGTRAHVKLSIRALKTDKHGAQLQLLLKEFDRDSDVIAPALPVLRKGETVAIEFDIDNPAGRKAFSFHLLGRGKGEIQIDEFRVSVRKITDNSNNTVVDRDVPSPPAS